MRALGRAGANELGTPGEMIVRSGNTSFRCKAAYLDDASLDAQCSEMGELAADEEGDTNLIPSSHCIPRLIKPRTPPLTMSFWAKLPASS